MAGQDFAGGRQPGWQNDAGREGAHLGRNRANHRKAWAHRATHVAREANGQIVPPLAQPSLRHGFSPHAAGYSQNI
jgi:hypothetical protein